MPSFASWLEIIKNYCGIPKNIALKYLLLKVHYYIINFILGSNVLYAYLRSICSYSISQHQYLEKKISLE